MWLAPPLRGPPWSSGPPQPPAHGDAHDIPPYRTSKWPLVIHTPETEGQQPAEGTLQEPKPVHSRILMSLGISKALGA